SSADMKVSDPRPYLASVDRDRYAKLLERETHPYEVRAAEPTVEVARPKFDTGQSGAQAARTVTGQVQRFGDHVDTDAIIPGEFCHLTKLEELGAKAFHFVRPEFAARAKAGQTIVVAQEGWGSGSSREQAVWALIGAGITAVVAKSYAFIHKRNLVN